MKPYKWLTPSKQIKHQTLPYVGRTFEKDSSARGECIFQKLKVGKSNFVLDKSDEGNNLNGLKFMVFSKKVK